MKTLLQTLFFFLLVTQICFAQWYLQYSNSAVNLSAIMFIDTNNGFAVGDNGVILHTTNSGANWELQSSGTSLTLFDVFFTDVDTGWVAGGTNNTQGIILSTTNGGENWSTQLETTTDLPLSIFFNNSRTGWSCSLEGTIWKTTDGGENWIEVWEPSGPNLIDICFKDTNTGISVGSENGDGRSIWAIVMTTTNGGISWNEISLGDPNYLNSACVVGTNSFYAVGGHYGFFAKSTDLGLTWTTSNLSSPPYDQIYRNIFFLDELKGWITGMMTNDQGEGIMLSTIDGGQNWETQVINGSIGDLGKVFFIDSLNGWVLGGEGTIFHTTNGGVVSVEGETNGIPNKYNLTQNYPNPFNPSTIIKFQIPKRSEVTVKVFSLLGQVVKTLVNEEKEAGIYEIEFNAENHPSGVYFYQLRAGDFIQTKKMILLK